MTKRLKDLVQRVSVAQPHLRWVVSRLRPYRLARQLFQRPNLLEAERRLRELGLNKRWYSLVNHAEVSGRGTHVARLDRRDGLDELRRDPRFAALEEPVRRGLEAWPENGYLVVEGLIEPERLRALNDDIDRLVREGDLREHYQSPRFMNPHETSVPAAAIASDPRVVELIELIMGRSARLFQTISFLRGSQQDAHSDAFHMMTEPAGYLVGVWVALEDIDEDSGPVFYLPGSHRLPYVMSEDLELDDPGPLFIAEKGAAYVERMRQIAETASSEPKHFTARAGDVLFWHHNLLHGGSEIARPESTRRSLVGHYFGHDVLCYHEVTEHPALHRPNRLAGARG